MEKSKEKLEILKKIDEYERKGMWDVDVNEDPPSTELEPHQIDYLRKKISSKVKARIASKMGEIFFEKMIKNNQMIIKEVKGIENFLAVEGGAIITSNHFNANDNYAIHRSLIPYLKNKNKFYKVIREGNYTGFKGLFGFLFRNANTLPLSSNMETMKNFMRAIKELLERGEKILIYPEQAMWWNYRKPRPLKDGAFKLAVNNNAPIIPCFITMEDSEFIDPDGFNVQAYTINFLKPIYPNSELTKKENIEYMRNRNFQLWKECYESTYGIPLVYLIEESDEKEE